ncbi:MAG: phosphotransferase [Deltaproteobacteria bacterium]|nr:phosphotransferase [Nannocystaceae bacterium]
MPAQSTIGCLTAEDAFHVALEHGLISSEEAVEQAIEVRDMSRRNVNFVFIRRNGQGFVLKQGGREADLSHEAAAYEWLWAQPADNSIADRVPKLVGVLNGSRAIAVELLDAATLRIAWPTMIIHRSLLETYCSTVGTTLARLHGSSSEGLNGTSSESIHRRGMPHLPVLRPIALHLSTVTRGQALVMAAVLEADLDIALSPWLSAWRSSAVIHGDVRPDNLLVDLALLR